MTQFSSDRGGAVLEAVGITVSHDLTDVQHLSANLTHSLTRWSLRYCYADFDIECHNIPV
jgi:hypothetical protein